MSYITAELIAADACVQLGFAGAVRTPAGADGGLDVVDRARGLACQVKAWNRPVGRPEVQNLVGAAEGAQTLVFFATSGYSSQAREYADRHGIALFTVDLGRKVWQPANPAAGRLFEASPPTSRLPVRASSYPSMGWQIAWTVWAVLAVLASLTQDADNPLGTALVGVVPAVWSWILFSRRLEEHRRWKAQSRRRPATDMRQVTASAADREGDNAQSVTQDIGLRPDEAEPGSRTEEKDVVEAAVPDVERITDEALTNSDSAPTATSPVRRSHAGVGDDVIVLDDPGIMLLDLTHVGAMNFIVWALDEAYHETDLLVNRVGTYRGSVVLDLVDGARTTALAITADGPWTIELRDIGSLEATEGPISGVGDYVAHYSGPTKPAAIRHEGEGHFAVTTASFITGNISLPVNEVGPYSGTVVLDGPSLVMVTCESAWTIAPRV